MANVFGILTAIVLALAGFVAYQNKARYETEISNTGNENDRAAAFKLGNNPDSAKKKIELTNEKAKLGYTEGRLALAKSNYATTFAKRTEVDEEVVKLWAIEGAQKKTNEDLTQQIADKTAKVAANKSKLDEIREKTARVGDIKELAAKMRTINGELEELAQSISTTEAKLANLTALNNQTESHANAMKKKFEIISSGQSLPTLNTRIRSIYPTWGFVTLASGNHGGVVSNSTLDVVRDGVTIAKLLVTAVESNSASASIIPDSLAKDTTLMVGDRVIPAAVAPKPVIAPKPAATPKPAVAPKPTDALPAADPAAKPDPTAPAADPTAPAATPDPTAPAADPTAPAATPDPAAPAAPAATPEAPAAGTQ